MHEIATDNGGANFVAAVEDLLENGKCAEHLQSILILIQQSLNNCILNKK